MSVPHRHELYDLLHFNLLEAAQLKSFNIRHVIHKVKLFLHPSYTYANER